MLGVYFLMCTHMSTQNMFKVAESSAHSRRHAEHRWAAKLSVSLYATTRMAALLRSLSSL